MSAHEALGILNSSSRNTGVRANQGVNKLITSDGDTGELRKPITDGTGTGSNGRQSGRERRGR